MKKFRSLVVVAVAAALVGGIGGRLLATPQQDTTYLVVEEFEFAPDMALSDGIERLSTWVRALRATGKHSSVRLFMHDWGSEAAFYIISETTDWNAIGTLFADVLAAEPDFMNQPFGFAGHSDEILTEIPVQ